MEIEKVRWEARLTSLRAFFPIRHRRVDRRELALGNAIRVPSSLFPRLMNPQYGNAAEVPYETSYYTAEKQPIKLLLDQTGYLYFIP
ncbi:hypothetical protein M569_00098 [Genlisea aurea]|uniref:Uncharacterized protein n=1 Tax=Genlisea aurea TaxID=192259 RepID=S8EP36_9LAMI|nr:hypothetical protein M569_00098 [Genlisea aurea]